MAGRLQLRAEDECFKTRMLDRFKLARCNKGLRVFGMEGDRQGSVVARMVGLLLVGLFDWCAVFVKRDRFETLSGTDHDFDADLASLLRREHISRRHKCPQNKRNQDETDNELTQILTPDRAILSNRHSAGQLCWNNLT